MIEPTKYCLGCSYVLDGLSVDRCPECGRQFDPQDSLTFGKSADKAVKLRWYKRLAVVALIVLPLDFICAGLAYETIGEVYCGFLFFVAILGNMIAVAFLPLPRVALIWLVIVAILLIPHQLFLGTKLFFISTEARQIVQYLEETKIAKGEYPGDLTGYVFSYPSLQHHFHSYGLSKKEGGFILHWHIGNRGASHWYSPSDGWDYYPD